MGRLRVVVVLVIDLVACSGSSRQSAKTVPAPDCVETAAQVVEKIRVDMTDAGLPWQPGQALDSWRKACLEGRWSADSRQCMVDAVTSSKWPLCLSQEQSHALSPSRPQRIIGDPEIVPDDETKIEIKNSGRRRIDSSFKLCLDRRGAVISVSPLKSSGFPAYDTVLMNTMWQWTYSPFIVLDCPMRVCTAVTFIYSQSP